MLTLARCLLPGDSGPQLVYIILRKSYSGVGDLLSDLSRKVVGTPNNKTDPMGIGQLTVTPEAIC
jgi:hypothetical protein